MFDLNKKHKRCLICGEPSEGKPQCLNCWTDSIYFLEEELEGTICSAEEYKKLYNSLVQEIRTSFFFSKTRMAYNQLIAMGLFAKDSYGIFDDKIKIYEKAYSDADDLLKSKDNKDIGFISNIDNEDTTNNDFRKKYKAELACEDGHYVRSPEEREIDNYLYRTAKIIHAYEPKFRLTPEEIQSCKKAGLDRFYPDFYIPEYNLYIEYFGRKDEKYKEKMDLKIKIYSKREDINFRYLTYKDNNILLEKLEDILEEFRNKTNEIKLPY